MLFPGAAVRPYGGYYDEVADSLELVMDEGAPGTFGRAVERVVVDRGEMTLFVAREHLVAVARALRDAPDAAVRDVQRRLRRALPAARSAASCTPSTTSCRSPTAAGGSASRSRAPTPTAHIPSIVSVYPANDWHERETWDMFGIEFDGHPALTRILMPDDWPGHPQRKDYPLGGIPVEYKGATIPPPDQRRSYN